MTGGQRLEQLVRLRWADVHADAITIHDAKGRMGPGPRAHTVPLITGDARDLQVFDRAGEHVFSATPGSKPIADTTLLRWVAGVVGSRPSVELPAPSSGRCGHGVASAGSSLCRFDLCAYRGAQKVDSGSNLTKSLTVIRPRAQVQPSISSSAAGLCLASSQGARMVTLRSTATPRHRGTRHQCGELVSTIAFRLLNTGRPCWT